MKSSSVFICQQCGNSSPKWFGQCPQCGSWNTAVETVVEKKTGSKANQRASVVNVESYTSSLKQVDMSQVQTQRISTGMGELDRVLGEGLVKGSVVLLGGEPGIGKSTLLTQLVIYLLHQQQILSSSEVVKSFLYQGSVPKKLYYVNGEENAAQIASRVERLYTLYAKSDSRKSDSKVSADAWREQCVFISTNDVDKICSIVEQEPPFLLIVDSIQTVETDELTGAAGSFGQVRESTQKITEVAKRLQIPTILVGHVTKEGTIAGPKVLEHIVDTVLELSGERNNELRTIRAIKNRFGATDEVGLFVMNETGLKEVTNPSEIFLQHAEANVPGSATVSIIEGTRPLLIEVQALVISSHLAMPRRVAQGIQLPRLQVLTAVLQKHGRIGVNDADVFVNVAGGLQVREPAADLGIAMAIASSEKNKPLPNKSVFIGEVGLLGEIRDVMYLDKRIKEAKRLGYDQVYSRKTHKHIGSLIRDVL